MVSPQALYERLFSVIMCCDCPKVLFSSFFLLFLLFLTIRKGGVIWRYRGERKGNEIRRLFGQEEKRSGPSGL